MTTDKTTRQAAKDATPIPTGVAWALLSHPIELKVVGYTKQGTPRAGVIRQGKPGSPEPLRWNDKAGHWFHPQLGSKARVVPDFEGARESAQAARGRFTGNPFRQQENREARARELLGVSPEATPGEVKVAFRRLASQHHPDKGGSADAFALVRQAYETLL